MTENKKKKIIEFLEFSMLFLFVLACLVFGFEMHNAYGYNGKKVDVETVAGIDPYKAVKALRKSEKKEHEQKLKEEKEREEIEIMARLVYAENGNDSYSQYEKAMLYTGSVVLNRVKSNKFPNTIEGVVYQRGQYACTWDGGIYKTPSKEAYKVAKELIKYGSKLPSDVLYGAEFKQGRVYEYVAGTYYCY